MSIVCSAQIPFFSDASQYAAKAETVAGQVSILKDSQPWALSVGDSVQVQQMILTGPDGYAVFRVTDGSTFEVYPSSRVTFRKNPGNWKDLLDLWVGRVRVHIQHMGSIPNNNRVLTPTAVISVRGTTFDVEVSYDEETTIVEVEEGVVDVRHALLPSNDAKVLQAGESIRVYKNEPLIARGIDKGEILKRGFKALLDAMTTIATRGPSASGGSVGGVGVGDADKKVPPPPPPPPVGLPPLN